MIVAPFSCVRPLNLMPSPPQFSARMRVNITPIAQSLSKKKPSASAPVQRMLSKIDCCQIGRSPAVADAQKPRRPPVRLRFLNQNGRPLSGGAIRMTSCAWGTMGLKRTAVSSGIDPGVSPIRPPCSKTSGCDSL